MQNRYAVDFNYGFYSRNSNMVVRQLLVQVASVKRLDYIDREH
jgi:hypothetical protein